MPNVIITPRIAGITSQKWPAVLPVFKENLRRFIAGEPLNNLVDKELRLLSVQVKSSRFKVSNGDPNLLPMIPPVEL